MNRNYIGARRKRTNTPVLNRQRAVEYRHRPYAPVKSEKPELSAEPAVIEEVNEIIDTAAEETVTETAEPETVAKAVQETATDEPAVNAPQVNAVQSAQTVGFFGKLASAFKGLFSKNKETAVETGDDKRIVSDLKTWMNSPIDPDEEPAEIAGEEVSAIDTAEETAVAETEEATDTEETSVVSEETAAPEETIAEEPAEEPEKPSEETEISEAAEVTEMSSEETVVSEPADDAEEKQEEIQQTETVEETAAEDTEEPSDETEIDPLEEILSDEDKEPQDEVAETVTEEVSSEDPETAEVIAAEEETEETADKEEEPVSEEPAEETVTEAASTDETEEVTEEAASEETAEETQTQEEETAESEEEEAALTREEKKALRKEIRKETKTQLLDEIIDSPKAGLLTMLLAPGYAMKKVSTVEKTTLAAPSVLLLNVIKWAAVGTFFAMFFEKFINHFNYSFVRLNFTGTASLAFRMGIFGLIAEYVSWIVISLFCGLIRRKISVFKLMEVEARSALGVALLFVIGAVLVWKDMFAFGVIAGVCGIVVGIMTKGYGMDLVLPIGKNTQLVLVTALVIAATLISFSYFPLILSGLMDIFRTILNI